MTLTRRQTLAGAASLPLAAAATTATTTAARAGAEMKGTAVAPFMRVKLGDFEVTTLLAGTRSVPDPHSIFGLNVAHETFQEVSQAAHIPAEMAQFFFTPTVVNTGSELVLFDTGQNADGLLAALQSAGYSADQVDTVVLTHMHGDHIGGLMQDGSPTFPKARYVTGQVEFDAWAEMENEGFETNVRPLAEKMTFMDDGGDVTGGISAKAAFGHTPGHMGYMLDSGDEQLLLGADFANHYVWSLAHPDWEVKFDMDKAKAAETRRALLEMLAAERMPFVGYHMPFPAFGYVEKQGDGFVYVPHSYQLLL